MQKFKTLFQSLLLLQIAFVFFASNAAQAAGWTKYEDEDGIFHVLIPDTYKINKKYFRINENEVALSGEVIATVDQTQFVKNVVKQYIVKYEQTIAQNISQNDIASLLNLELGKYIDYYTAMGGVLRNKETDSYNGWPGGEIIISYRDEEKGIQSIRARVIFTDTTKVEQIMMGPEDSMYAPPTKDFFSSLLINDGRTRLTGDIQKEWDTVTSPFQLMNQIVPRKNPPFVMDKPEFSNNDKIERMSMKFVDPVYGYTLFYNIYGYRFGTLLSTENVQNVVMDKHLKKFKVDIRNLKFALGKKNDYPILSTTMHFSPPDQYPFMNTIKLYVHYFGNFIVVQELVGSSFHVNSVLAQNITKYFKFTPIEGNQLLMQEKADRAMKDLKEETSNPSTD